MGRLIVRIVFSINYPCTLLTPISSLFEERKNLFQTSTCLDTPLTFQRLLHFFPKVAAGRVWVGFN